MTYFLTSAYIVVLTCWVFIYKPWMGRWMFTFFVLYLMIPIAWIIVPELGRLDAWKESFLDLLIPLVLMLTVANKLREAEGTEKTSYFLGHKVLFVIFLVLCAIKLVRNGSGA